MKYVWGTKRIIEGKRELSKVAATTTTTKKVYYDFDVALIKLIMFINFLQ